MPRQSIRHERRGADRPAVGDWKPCPSCAGGMLLFTEQYRTKQAPISSTIAMPAWVCDKCPGVTFLRVEHQPRAVREKARNVRARANRGLMKSRFVRSRARTALRKSLSKKQR